MSASPTASELLSRLLRQVDKPARYAGGEVNSVAKPGQVRARLALCFPDLYEIAESHLGLKVLYEIVNAHPDYAAERVYAWAPDLERLAKSEGLALCSLESRRPLRDFDCVGFTLQYELSYPTLLAMLCQGGVTLQSSERHEGEPLVIGGGAGAYNPEPLAPFFDAFLLGDGEEAVLELLDVVAGARERKLTRAATLAELARVPGFYVPSRVPIAYQGLNCTLAVPALSTPRQSTSSLLHDPTPAETRDSQPSGPAANVEVNRPLVVRRAVASLDAAPSPRLPLVPNVEPVHERVAIEIQRGCSRGCRFCQAGMVTRPTRQRSPATILDTAAHGLANTGCATVGLLSLSAGDYPAMEPLVDAFLARHAHDRIALSLPSLRTDTLRPALAAQLSRMKTMTWTVAPEAGSERLRRVINKNNSETDLLLAVRAAAQAGSRQIKLYFMIGLPTETEADLDAIVELALKARAEGRAIRSGFDVVVAVSTFVPKPHTPFQWERQLSLEETRARQHYLRARLAPRRVTLRYHDPEQSFIEGVLARGDRRLGVALASLAQAGSRLDAWTEHFDFARWKQHLEQALAPHGLRPEDYLAERDAQLPLAWDHLSAGVHKGFLARERELAFSQEMRADCALTGQCYACGACDLALPTHARQAALGKRAELVPRLAAPNFAPLVEPVRAEALLGSRIEVSERKTLRFRYAKLGPAAYLAQIDTANHLLRAVRQSGMPVLHSEGHTPRPRVSFSPACPLGLESLAEYFDVLCAEAPAAQTFVALLNAHLPAGLEVVEATDLPAGGLAISDATAAAEYKVVLDGELPAGELAAAWEQFSAAGHCWVRVPRKIRPRHIDARREVLAGRVEGGELSLTLAVRKAASLKAVEVVAALVGTRAAARARLRKENIIFVAEPAPEPEAQVPEPGSPVLDLCHAWMHQADADAEATLHPAPRAPSHSAPYAD